MREREYEEGKRRKENEVINLFFGLFWFVDPRSIELEGTGGNAGRRLAFKKIMKDNES